MTTGLPIAPAKPGVFPIPMDAAASATSDWMRKERPGWQDFEWTRADSATIPWIVRPVGRREKQSSATIGVATGPSEATVLPIALDATDRGDGMDDLGIASGESKEAALGQAASEAGLDVEREVIAHLPPKRTFGSLLRVLHRGRACPNITLEWTPDKHEET